MSVNINQIDANTDTFANWVSITNEIANAFTVQALTANSTMGETGNTTQSLNAKLFGTFVANTIHIRNTITTNTTSYNVALEAIYLDLKNTSKFYTNGELNVKGLFTVDTVASLRFSDRATTYSSTTGWLKANSTGGMAFANLNVSSTDLDPTEFALSSNVGYANSTTSTFDVVCYDESVGKWVRTTLKHLGTLEVDNLTLGIIRANTAGSVRVNANTNFGGTTSSLYVSNTAARVGIGGITNPQAPLHVQGAVYATGDVTAYYTSDARLKKDIERIDNALEKVRWLNGVTFKWDKEQIEKLDNVGPKPDLDIGLIAQDVEKVFPEAVHLRSDGFKAVDYGKLVPVLIEAVKELSYRVNILEAELEERYHVSSR